MQLAALSEGIRAPPYVPDVFSPGLSFPTPRTKEADVHVVLF